jgi:heptaprenyl diphosphate synthase
LTLPQEIQDSLTEYGCLIQTLAEDWDVQAVYKVIEGELDSKPGLLGEVCSHVLSARGKGLRPLLVLICSQFGFLDKEKSTRLAAALEVLHTAMLIHDDVLDVSPVRRDRDSVNYRWNNNVAVLAGDFLFGKSLEMVSQFGQEAVGRFASVILKACSGEFRQLEAAFDTSLEITAYKEIIRNKTAVMLANCCAIGAAVSGADISMVHALESYGLNLGMAFQIRDDVADWFQGNKAPGKPVISDLGQGVVTLPVLFVLKLSPYRDKIEKIINSKKISPNHLAFISREIQKTESLELALNVAAQYLEKAYVSLEPLPDSPSKKALQQLAAIPVKIP